MQNKLLHSGLVLAILLLTACSRGGFVPPVDEPRLPGHIEGASDATIMDLQKKFVKSGIAVVAIGQNYMLSIPASALFANQSPQLTWGSYALLNDVACYLKQFRKITIHVTSFVSPYRSEQREKALSLARSRVVGDYLWSQGVDSRFIFTEGLGSDKPIISARHGGDQSPNARVEITFREAIA